MMNSTFGLRAGLEISACNTPGSDAAARIGTLIETDFSENYQKTKKRPRHNSHSARKQIQRTVENDTIGNPARREAKLGCPRPVDRGEKVEHAQLDLRFGSVLKNYLQLINKQKNLIAFTASFGQASVIFACMAATMLRARARYAARPASPRP